MKLPAAVRALLYPLSVCYGWVVKARLALYRSGRLKQKRLNGIVISVGNLTVGGTGKTPMVLWLAERFVAKGKRVAILSRGYRGSAGMSDEIAMLKQRLGDQVVFGVGADRHAEGKRLEARQPVDVFLLDDGFQHLQLARDVDVLMLDGSRKLVTEALLPAGLLREPVSGCGRADILVVTRKPEREPAETLDAPPHAIFYAKTRLLGFRLAGQQSTPRYSSEIKEPPVFAFCGIGNPDAFFNDLKNWRVPLAGTMMFSDHHRYSEGDLQKLRKAAERAGARAFVTTEKDEQNLRSTRELGVPAYVAVIDLVMPSESEFDTKLDRLIASKRGVAA